MSTANVPKPFKYLSVVPLKQGKQTFYQARLVSRLGRQTIGLGRDYALAIEIASELDSKIQEWDTLQQPVEIDVLKSISTEQKESKKAKNFHLRIVEKDSLQAIWSDYVSFHISTKVWEQTYVVTHIQTVGNLIECCPYSRLEDKQKIVEWLFTDNPKRSPATSKQRFKLIVAAVDWASKQGKIPRKWGIEYRDILAKLKVKTAKKDRVNSFEDDIDVFAIKEVYAILDAFKGDTFSRFQGKHSQYFPYVYFLWLTGCRPSEAIALKWDNVHLEKSKLVFCEAEVYTSGKNIKKEGTKTVPSRSFPINGELKTLLESINHRAGYVFRRSDGKPITHQAFRRVWKLILDSLGLRYRYPYQLRHSMISYHANNDFPIHKLSQLVGNSDEVLVERYLKLDIERIQVPSIIR